MQLGLSELARELELRLAGELLAAHYNDCVPEQCGAQLAERRRVETLRGVDSQDLRPERARHRLDVDSSLGQPALLAGVVAAPPRARLL
jgi:hypothetical protein